jgi:hypothetical protein
VSGAEEAEAGQGGAARSNGQPPTMSNPYRISITDAMTRQVTTRTRRAGLAARRPMSSAWEPAATARCTRADQVSLRRGCPPLPPDRDLSLARVIRRPFQGEAR